MRENIGLYRGKRLDNDEWVTGWYYEAINYFSGDTIPMIAWINQVPSDMDRMIPAFEPINYEVDPETVGEFTGVMDKNGKRIFEGDIVGSMDGHDGYLSREGYIVGVVNWDNETLSWQVTNRIEAESYEILNDTNETLEVIGNTHDNPELMEV